YIRVNDTGRNFRLVSAPLSDPARENWEEVVPHRPEVMLEGMDFFRDHYVLSEREDGLPHFRVTDLQTGEAHRLALPEAVYSAFPGPNPEFAPAAFRYGYQSLVTPSSVLDYDIKRRQSTLLKQTEVLGGYEPARYRTERAYATAPDGIRVP